MSEKLRKRLGKRGRVDDGVDNNVNTAYFNVTAELMGKDVSDDYPNVEVPIRKVESAIINEDNVPDIIQTDVSQLRETQRGRQWLYGLGLICEGAGKP